MGAIGRAALKAYFETGDYPTEAQFIDLMDSIFNFTDNTSDDLTQGSVKLLMTTAERVIVGNTSGENTGDQDLNGKEDEGVAQGIMDTHETTHPSPTDRDVRNQVAGAYVSKVGTPATNQVGRWTGNGTLEGNSNFIFTGTILTLTGEFKLLGTSKLSFNQTTSYIDQANVGGVLKIRTTKTLLGTLQDRIVLDGDSMRFHDVDGNIVLVSTAAGLNVTGNIVVSGTVDGVDVAALYTKVSNLITPKALIIENPTSSENIYMGHTSIAITVSQINDAVVGSTPSVTWNINHALTRNEGTPNKLFTTDRATTSESGAETTTFADDTIPAGSYYWFTTSAQSGTVTELGITLEYTID